MRTLAPLDLERTLNPEQIAAVTHGEGPQLVLAGAGSGKTRVITYRIAWLVREKGLDPYNIVAVTFTNKAAAEMRERAENLLEVFPLPTFVGTFHRFCLTLLRRYGERLGLRRQVVPVRNTRKIGKRDMVRNSGTPQIEVNPETFAVTVDGKHATVAPTKTIALNQRYFFS